MSENAQTGQHSQSSRAEGNFVRAAVVRAPLELLVTQTKHKFSRLRRELTGFPNPGFAESQIGADEYLRLFERLQSLASEPDLFLRAGVAPDLSTVGLFGKACSYAETVWDLQQTMREFMTYFQPANRLVYTHNKGRFRIRIAHTLEDRPAATAHTQYLVALILYGLRQARWTSDPQIHVHCPGVRPGDAAIFPEVSYFRSGPFGQIEFNEDQLRRPLKSSNPLLLPVATAAVSRFARRNLETANLPEMVLEMQLASIESSYRPVTLADTATLLDLPTRTLQARLKKTQTSFAGIRNDALHRMARQELSAGRSVTDTSQMLGFIHRQSFSEAFASWEGMPPSVFASRAHL